MIGPPNDTLQEEFSIFTDSQNSFFFKVQSEFSVQDTTKEFLTNNYYKAIYESVIIGALPAR